MKKLFFFLILVQTTILMSCGHKEIANSDPSEFCIPDSLMLNITLDTVHAESVMGDLKLSGKISFNEDNVVKVFPQSPETTIARVSAKSLSVSKIW